MKTAEEWIKWNDDCLTHEELVELAQKEAYNQGVKDALKLAAEKARVKEVEWTNMGIDLTTGRRFTHWEVNKESILNLEKELLK